MTKTFRDRILEFTRVPARELSPNPRNWRTHNDKQQAALAGVLAEIGFAGALLARRLDDGRLELIDGHLRAATSAKQLVPVLVLDVSEEEADKLLATFDTLSSMAGADGEKLNALLDRIDPSQPAVKQVLVELRETASRTGNDHNAPDEVDIPSAWQVLIECGSEQEQQQLYDRLIDEGLDCRLLML